jgi:hypothetical protein
MKDLLGNTLQKGNLVYWPDTKLVCHVMDVEEPQIETGDGQRAAHLILRVVLPVERIKGFRDFQIFSLIKAVDPQQDEALDRAIGPQVVKPKPS